MIHCTYLSPFHISLTTAVRLFTNTILVNFVRLPQDRLIISQGRKAAATSWVEFSTCSFSLWFLDDLFKPQGSRKAAARQPRDNRKIDVRFFTKWSWYCSQLILAFVLRMPQGSRANNLRQSCVKRKTAARMLWSVRKLLTVAQQPHDCLATDVRLPFSV